ncbi:hypothetical protein D3C72_1319600 [compost metagenome]
MTRRHRYGSIQQFGQLEHARGVAAILDAATGNDQRLFGPAQPLCGTLRHAPRRTEGAVKLAAIRRIGSGARLDGFGQQVARQVQQHRTPARAQGRAEGLAHHLGNARGLRQGPGLLGHRAEQRLLVHLLKSIAVDVGGRQRTGKRHHG